MSILSLTQLPDMQPPVDIIKYPKIPLGVDVIDENLGSAIGPRRILVIAGDPGSYKTRFSTNALYHLQKIGKKVLFISMEMYADEIFAGIVSQETGYTLDHVYDIVPANQNEHFVEMLEKKRYDVIEHTTRMRKFFKSLTTNERITILDQDNSELVQKLTHDTELLDDEGKREQAKSYFETLFSGNHDVIMVDYFQMFASQSLQHHQNLELIADIMLNHAKKTNKALIILSQISRSDGIIKLRDSRKLEQACASLLHLKPAEENYDGKTKVIPVKSMKNRYGPNNKEWKITVTAHNQKFLNKPGTKAGDAEYDQFISWKMKKLPKR